MCGIAGIISLDKSKVVHSRLKYMTDSIIHRGPDGEGQWISNTGMVGFGHRRLSILDLSENGAQPMHYAEGRYTITFNGEIYNYLEIKATLLSKGYQFNSSSDTEVLLALYDFKKEKCLDDLDGMFSFAIYDEQLQTVFFARDRFGEKPFFYSFNAKDEFCFGSEMKELWATGIPKKVNDKMLYNYLSYGMLENANDKSETFYDGIRKLEASHYMILDLKSFQIKIHRYWDIDYNSIDNGISLEVASERLRELFYDSIKKRLRSDVPVGSSLSGGLDSSLVVTVIDELLKGTQVKQKTFSARFPGFAKDEGKFMQYVVDKTNVDPYYTFPDDKGLLEKINKVAYHQEEPFGSASICVQYDVMQLAKDNGVIVLLDGQGADEILAGYHYYYNAYFREMRAKGTSEYEKALEAYKNLHAGSQINRSIVPNFKTKVRNAFPQIVKPYFLLREKVRSLVNPTFASDFKSLGYDPSYLDNNLDLYTSQSLNESLYYSTMVKGLSELLRYADRNSMAHSREVRLPFLSHKLVEFLFTLPSEMKIQDGWTKFIMRKTFEQELPPEIAWRTDKIGYEPPQKLWMDSKSVKDTIQSKKELLVKQGILNKKVLSKQPGSSAANAVGDRSWEYWMAGNLF